MGSICSSKSEPVQTEQDKSSSCSEEARATFKGKRASFLAKDPELSVLFKNILKKQSPITLEYFACAEMIIKRKTIFQSSQRCGDDKEKGNELLATWAKEIMDTFGTILFDFDGKFYDLKTKFAGKDIEDLGADAFDVFMEKAFKHVQSWMLYKCKL